MSPITMLMTLQNQAALFSISGTLVIVAVVLFVVFSSRKGEEAHEAKRKVYTARAKYFFWLSIFLLAGLVISLRLLPYSRFQDPPQQVVTVVAMQWAWKMANGTTKATPLDFAGGSEVTVPVNKNVVFKVTSADVNHSFGIYNKAGDLLAQTQAMPQYENDLNYHFSEAGNYYVICIEYCGMAHAFMMGQIHVK